MVYTRVIIFTTGSNFLATGDPAKAPPKTISQIIQSKYWSEEEEKLVIKGASDEDFLIFLGKFKSETLAKKALSERLKVKNSKPITSLSSENNDITIFSSSISSSE